MATITIRDLDDDTMARLRVRAAWHGRSIEDEAREILHTALSTETIAAGSQSLDQWLAELERRHPRAIELGLDRVGAVWRTLGAPRPARRVITVGGTNGKGSTVAFVATAARAAGWRVGCYTSPHLLRYNERITIQGREVGDEAIVAAFERIEMARGEVPLTYFEVGTLAALLLLAAADLDLAVLEVGLGGRLDAVNIVDADVAVVTTVALDHQDWLGGSRAGIGREKAGIARSGRPLLVGERDPEPALLDAATVTGARIMRLGDGFDWAADGGGARAFRFLDETALPLPDELPLPAPCQWDNAATALAALRVLAGGNGDDGIDMRRAAAGLAGASLPGRLQTIAHGPEVIVDIGHNAQAAQTLADWLRANPMTTDAVFSALADKDVTAVVRPLLGLIRHWHLAGLSALTPRGLAADALASRLAGVVPPDDVSVHAGVAEALVAARANAGSDGRVLVFGSFFTVAEAMAAMAPGD